MDASRWLGVVSSADTPQWHLGGLARRRKAASTFSASVIFEGFGGTEPNEQILNMERSSRGRTFHRHRSTDRSCIPLGRHQVLGDDA
jgi:hypothetical protein